MARSATAKAFARLAGPSGPAYGALGRRTVILPVRLHFDDPDDAVALVEAVVRRGRVTAHPA